MLLAGALWGGLGVAIATLVREDDLLPLWAGVLLSLGYVAVLGVPGTRLVVRRDVSAA